ncbi:MAG: hypothetical protein KBB37_05805 [Bacteroidia bacterium]|nr:hypothetical protein [Bacteroidia bacterium]MBP7260783.1 hypothetical protein [Bacteroidia bacterium]MBP9180382.1 hypothetical protein [Bacteroidia bacterium]MBP9724431.1 hypothetical protein [Bacteroidia bacterium]
MWYGLATEFLRVESFGKTFIARFGDLANKKVIHVNLVNIDKIEGVISINNSLEFNGIKSYLPLSNDDHIPWKKGEILKITHGAISHQFGIDLWGTATISYNHLSLSNEQSVNERITKHAGNSNQLKELEEFFVDIRKKYKYSTIERYLNDPILKEKYKVELENIDRYYRGPGKEFAFDFLKKEFG